tara:strand:+ start:315 stop:758 length:444 start_codon:yes stop_codon:yes gene_type:complete
MAKVKKICIAKNSGDKMEDVNQIEVIANKGIVNDRYFKDNNESDLQITLIESENIDYYNRISNSQMPYINFRRNVITREIELNNLVSKYFFIGEVKLLGIRLCDPCKYLQDMLNDESLVKKLINRGGLRCEIISDGKISTNDIIKII